jgi:hypothetical protein
MILKHNFDRSPPVTLEAVLGVVVAVVLAAEVVAEGVVVKVVAVAVAAVVIEEATISADQMVHQTHEKQPSGLEAPIHTVGHMAMTAPIDMKVVHVIIKNRAIEKQQPVLTHWEDPSKIKNFPNSTEVVGSYKQIILKRKRLTQQQKSLVQKSLVV